MNKIIWRSIFMTLLALFIVDEGIGVCAEKENAQNEPIQVEADRMESFQQENAVLFSGNVEARQGGLTIHADKMTVYYFSNEEIAKQPPGETQKIKKLFASGNVEIQNEGWVATGDNVEFFQNERKARLTGNTKVLQGNNMVTGDSLLLYLDEGKSIVEKSKKKGERVIAIIGPSENNGEEKKK